MAQMVLAILPGSAPHQRLQVALDQADGGGIQICLNEQHYAEGIGWFTQRSMQLEPRQWAQLQGVIGSEEVKRELEAEIDCVPATIPFPGPRGPRRLRQAVGHGPE